MEDKTLRICQRAYTEAVIKKSGQEHANPSLIPLDTSVHLTKNDEPKTDEEKAKMRSKPYRSLVGSLMYLACGTRPDISVAVSKLSRFLENLGEKHWNAGIKVRYDGDDVWCSSGLEIDVSKDCRLSSTEAEYMGLSECVKEVVWMRLLLKDLGSEQTGGTVVYEDNQGAMALAKNVGYQSRTMHIDIRYHFIREKVATGEVKLRYVEAKNQLADFLTKGLSTKTPFSARAQ
ncbi:unnamed protein product [Phytophthora fragariaefolia]|uniref:Unnamed protein product n=1 Tax=Phytophthora fragariaefolia TaxID=1490495 RepID=A0A9W6UBD3_9STRA|nr:unnamed protein product [Phytophthora fragariaefolia]